MPGYAYRPSKAEREAKQKRMQERARKERYHVKMLSKHLRVAREDIPRGITRYESITLPKTGEAQEFFEAHAVVLSATQSKVSIFAVVYNDNRSDWDEVVQDIVDYGRGNKEQVAGQPLERALRRLKRIREEDLELYRTELNLNEIDALLGE